MNKKMKFKNEFWAFIPARSGSKGLKNKNIKKLNRHPMIAYSIRFALKVKNIKKVVFSSDSKNYIKIAKNYGCKEFHLRSKKISSSKASEHSVFFDYLKKQILLKKDLPKFFVHLRPTSPIRSKVSLEKAINFFKKNHKKFSSVRSASKMSNPAYRSYRIINGKLSSITNKNFNVDKFCIPRSNFEETYMCGTIFDIYKTENILKGFLWGNKVGPYKINDFYNDIDFKEDLKIVEAYIKFTNYKI
tara:strand:- start:5663 stop:6397 length:735 start_codon:yes stop_codon:yes gene_type:complete